MGWFENQIKERKEADQKLLEDSLIQIAGIVLGEHLAEKISDRRIITKNAIDEILKYYHCESGEIPKDITEFQEQLDYCLSPHGLMSRKIELTGKWYKDSCGPILAFWGEERMPVALLPGKMTGYRYQNHKMGKLVRINKKTSQNLSKDAICFYRGLPLRKIGVSDLMIYMNHCINKIDVVHLVALTFLLTCISMFLPRVTKALTGSILQNGDTGILINVAICIFCISISAQITKSAKGLIQKRVELKTSLAVQAAMMMRLLSLPATFFRKYSAGELKKRAMSVDKLCGKILGLFFGSILTSVVSLLYVKQIIEFAPTLVTPALIIVFVTACFTVTTTLLQSNITRKQMISAAKEAGVSYSMISGIQKIKLTGSEKRAFARWMNVYAMGTELQFNPPILLKINTVISMSFGLLGNAVLYYIAAKSSISQADYLAFTVSYGALMGAFMSVSNLALDLAEIKPILDMAEPFLNAEPEVAKGEKIVTEITGDIELEHISFKYNENDSYVLDDLSLVISEGEYVAIVGKTGCGKSTLLRLLLGFEKPEKGAIYFNGYNMDRLNVPFLRKKIGTVMQDAGVFQGDIYSNIVLSAPELTVKDAWEVAEKVGIAEDIRNMPMGMNTIIGEGNGSISGGQRQRIMIARAIALKPQLLLFDEATSALDNKTQHKIVETLDSMKCTRVIVAHRLSTIRNCDRILVMDKGRIVEEGTYDELIAKKGQFEELVRKQRVDVE